MLQSLVARISLEHRLNSLEDAFTKRFDSLSKRVKLYGALVALVSAAIPTYGQMQASWAQDRIENTVEAKLTKAISKAADESAERSAQRTLEKLQKHGELRDKTDEQVATRN